MHSYSELEPDQIEAARDTACRTEAFSVLPLGFGKTIVMLTAIMEMREIYGPWRTLVLSTKAIVDQTWPDEIAGWEHTDGLSYRSAVGRDQTAVEARPDVLGLNFENLRWFYDLVDQDAGLLPEILVIDESDNMKSPGAFRVRRHIGMRRRGDPPGTETGFVHRFKRRYAMTATPNPESYLDLWAQEACVSPRRRLAPNITVARERYAHEVDRGKYVVHQTGQRVIERTLAPISIVSPRSNYLGDLPPPIETEVAVPWTEQGLHEYTQMEEYATVHLGMSVAEAVELIDDGEEGEATARNAGVLMNKLRQICSGFVFDEQGDEHVTADATAKLDVLTDLLQSEEATIIFTQYIPEREMIAAHFDERGIECHVGLPKSIDAWSKDPCHLLLHPKSGGAGVNLQYGSHRMVFYSLPWGSRDLTQTVGRIQRRGQKYQCRVFRLMRPGSIEHYVWQKAQRKIAVQNQFISNLRELKYGQAATA